MFVFYSTTQMAKTFVLSDNSLNSYGFRVLTDGIDTSQFERNPIMLFLHNRPWRGTKDEYSVIGRWENIRKEDGKLLADAVFDLNDPFAAGIASKVENDFIRMASMGFKPLELSSDPKHILVGQRYETVTKSVIREASIVDIGSNDNALALCDVPALYDESDALVELSAGKVPIIPLLKTSEMELNLVEIISLLGLAENASVSEVAASITALKTAKADLETKLADVSKAQKDGEIKALVDLAVSSKKITEAERAHYTKLASLDFDTTKALLDGKKPYVSLQSQTDGAESTPELEALLKLSGTELWRTGQLETLKKLSFEHFKLKYKEHFAVEYTRSV
jgi:hypothetical protein